MLPSVVLMVTLAALASAVTGTVATLPSTTVVLVSTTVPHTVAATATDITADIGFSHVGPLNISSLPPHVNFTCQNCSTHGTLELATGGYNTNDGIFIPEEFLTNGFIEFVAHNVGANFTIELALSPGFSATNFLIPLFRAHIFQIVTPLGNIDLSFTIYVPITLQLNSEVDIYPSLILEVPDGSTVYLDVGNVSNTYSKGFNESKITPSLNINAPNLNFHLLTGLEYVLNAEAGIGNTDVLGVGGNANASLGLPWVGMDVAELHHVNKTCKPPVGNEEVLDSAVTINYTMGANLEFDLGFYEGDFLSGNHHTNVTPWEVFNATLPISIPSSCLRYDDAAHELVTITPTPSVASSAQKSAAAPRLGPRLEAGIVASVFVVVGLLAIGL